MKVLNAIGLNMSTPKYNFCLILSLLRRPKLPVKSNGALKNHIFAKQAVKDTKVASKQPLVKCSMFSITLHHNNYRLVHENTE